MVTNYVADFYYRWLIFPLFVSVVCVDPGCEQLKKFLALSELPDNCDRERNPANFP